MNTIACALLTAGLLTAAGGVYTTRTPTPTPDIIHELAALKRAQTTKPSSRRYLEDRHLRTQFSPAYNGAVADYHRKEAERYGRRAGYLAIALSVLSVGTLGALY